MKIGFSIKKDALDTVIAELQDVTKELPKEIADKCLFYMFNRCFKKLLKKQIDKADDFTNKPFKITLLYEEAATLYLELNKLRTSENCYTANAVLSLKNILHQKLK